ncbi:hypothetical protein P154DRAFT_485242 [Amniculicola lignicola CBS 123094]|uniref:Initiator tRNA phosphoribosyl transferase n=1 Tax=Amniculicola lignicola CBS 123094 TaxID=1392246 RepID=A0A6A5WUY4_9PLEO|nr:hypothetical protein P154DRAFT_485242 [Amniculicola lignicola CBS 123094]
MAQPLTQSDLIFPTASLSISSTLSSLKRSTLSIHNRLSSIISDSKFVGSVSHTYGLPLVANERCGSWYIPLEKKVGSAYFKSTDGHTNEWSFSLRRLNMQILDIIEEFGGCVIVDSTRRGKSMPDALSKTIPIWCCVLNRALFSDSGPHELYTPPTAISKSEHAQMEKRMSAFLKQFLDICKPDLPELRSKLKKPLRPIWVMQNSTLPENPPEFHEFCPIVLCTASRRVHGGEMSEGGYIQGAADDHEAWAQGLTPPIFWKHKEELLGTNEGDLPDLIGQLAKQEKGPDVVPIVIKPTQTLFISSSGNVNLQGFNVVISCTPEPLSTTRKEDLKKKYLHLRCATNKLGSRDLRTQLLHLPSFFSSLSTSPNKDKILICCPTGKDFSIGVALAVLCLYTKEDGTIDLTGTVAKLNKTFIKQRLTWISNSGAGLNPSRETLKAINAFLMPDPSTSPPSPPPGLNSTLIYTGLEDSQDPLNPKISKPEDSPVTLHSSLPKTLFHTLQTTSAPWPFTRTLTSALPTHPSGTVTGTATFTPYTPPTSISTPSSEAHPMLLYAEEGEFVTTTNLRFTARQKYIYALNKMLNSTDGTESAETPEDEYISVYFHSETAGLDGLFVEMGPLSLIPVPGGSSHETPSEPKVMQGSEEEVWEAQNREQHLCGADLYTAFWKFGGGMAGSADEGEAKWWEVRYKVKGPKKDYVSRTRYSRA